MQKLLKLLDFKYIVAALLIVVPLYPKFPFIQVPGTYVSIRLEDFLLAIVGVLTVVKLVPQIKNLAKDNIVRAIVLFCAVGLVSLISGAFLTQTVGLSLGSLHFLRRIEYFVPFFAVLTFYQGEKPNVGFLIKILLLTVTLIFLYGLGQRYLNFPVIATQNLETSKGIALRWTPGAHLNSTFAGHYDLASYLILVLPIIVTALFLFKGVKTKVVFALVWLAGLWLMAAAISRISIVSYMGATTLALLLAKKYKAIPVAIVISLLFFGMSTDLLSRYTRIFEVTKIRILQIISITPSTVLAAEEPFLERVSTPTPAPVKINVFEDRSTSIRLNVEWPRAIRAFSKNPLLGTGFSSITLATDNDYLRLLGEVGILGFAAFVLILVRLGKLVLRAIPRLSKFSLGERALVAGFAGALPGVLLNAVFIDVFEASKFAIMFWLITGLVVVVARRYETD